MLRLFKNQCLYKRHYRYNSTLSPFLSFFKKTEQDEGLLKYTCVNDCPEKFHKIMNYVYGSSQFRRHLKVVSFDKVFTSFRKYLLDGNNPKLFTELIKYEPSEGKTLVGYKT